jgi:LAGLIDADG endonuclease
VIVSFGPGVCADLTTTVKPGGELAAFIGGFVTAEGTFVCGGPRSAFAFAVGLGAADSATCELLLNWFEVGRLQRHERRKPHYDDEVAFTVRRFHDLIDIVIPFMDEHLPRSYKRQQYEAWRAQLLDYWENTAKRRRPCSVSGCDETRRAKGLCRRHYYVRFGK